MRKVQRLDEVAADFLSFPFEHAVRDCAVGGLALRLNVAWHLLEAVVLLDKATARISTSVVGMADDLETHVAASGASHATLSLSARPPTAQSRTACSKGKGP